MKQRLLQFILNPFVLSALITIGIIAVIPNKFNKYQINKISERVLGGTGTVYYQDLDGDFKSESIITQVNNIGNSSYMIFSSDGDLIDQFNFSYPFADKIMTIWFQDTDDDGYSEIYHISKHKDSLLLNVFDYAKKDQVKEIFVDTMVLYNNIYEVGNAGLTSFDLLNRVHDNDVVFALRAVSVYGIMI